MTVVQPAPQSGKEQIDVKSIVAELPAASVTLNTPGPTSSPNAGGFPDPIVVPAGSQVKHNAGGAGETTVPLSVSLENADANAMADRSIGGVSYTNPAYGSYLTLTPSGAEFKIATFNIYLNRGATHVLALLFHPTPVSIPHNGSTTTLVTRAFQSINPGSKVTVTFRSQAGDTVKETRTVAF
jgi:hypothetical protein